MKKIIFLLCLFLPLFGLANLETAESITLEFGTPETINFEAILFNSTNLDIQLRAEQVTNELNEQNATDKKALIQNSLLSKFREIGKVLDYSENRFLYSILTENSYNFKQYPKNKFDYSKSNKLLM